MTTKLTGVRHGAALRARIATAQARARTTATRCVDHGRRAALYLAGFAQGLLRSGNA